MTNPTPQPLPSVWRRIPLAFSTFFSTLADPHYALRIIALTQPIAAAAPVAPVAPVNPVAPLKLASTDAALQLLAILQREARLIDFTQENLSSYSDADIGAAARVVHEGCAKVLRDYFTLEPVRPEAEGSRITLAPGFDAATVRLSGNVQGSAPFHGSLSHRGWRASSVRLPKLSASHDAAILAPAEVEL